MNSLGFNKKNKDTKVIVAMSGGVDSSVAAAMLKNEGYDVTGITLKLYNQSNVKKTKSCCAGQDIEDAKQVADQFNFPHFTYDYQDRFFSGVIDEFVETYSKGETPVPCISCNQTVKFTDLLQEAKNYKADALVTGHYVRRIGGAKDSKMFKAKDINKDQSYFLFATLQDQLDYLRFPLGNYLKSEIRDIAKKLNLTVKDKPDSQDICFVTTDSYRDLINKLKPELNVKGNFLNMEENIVEQTHARHILVKINELQTDKQANEKLIQLKLRIDNGDDFGLLAKGNSDDAMSAIDNGDLGWSIPGELVPEFQRVLDGLGINETSEPFKSRFGWHIAQVLGRRNHDNTESIKRARARKVIGDRKLNEALQNWNRELLDEAYIEYRLDGI